MPEPIVTALEPLSQADLQLLEEMGISIDGALKQRIEEALGFLIESQLAGFAQNLGTARMMWRKYRDLVEAPEFPEHLRSACLEQHQYEPEDPNLDLGEPAITDDRMQTLRRRAIAFAQREADHV